MTQMATLQQAIDDASGPLTPITVGSTINLVPGVNYYDDSNTLSLNGATINFTTPGQQYVIIVVDPNSTISLTACNFIYTGVDPSAIFWFATGQITIEGTGSAAPVPGIFLAYGTTSSNTPAISTTNVTINGNLYAGSFFSDPTKQGAITLTSTTLNSTVNCFLKGTKILTDRGYFPIEELKIEDNVIIHGSIIDNSEIVLNEKIQTSPIKWIGKFNAFRHNASDLPVCFKPGSLGEFLPENDLFVSPGHRMILDGKIVIARDLVNGETILQEDTHETIEYYHFELDCHGIIMTEGVLSETFLDVDDSKLGFHTM
jgi:hypothetical protein